MSVLLKVKNSLRGWFDSYHHDQPTEARSVLAIDNDLRTQLKQIDWVRLLPFILVHVFALSVFFVSFSSFAIYFGIAFYLLRMFAITGFYHRYFSHKSFKTSRVLQFVFAVIGAACVQKGALWWSAYHRHHHQFSDQADDIHTPSKGFFWSHMGWFMSRKYLRTRLELVKDWAKYKELVLVDRYAMIVPVVVGVCIYLLGEYLAVSQPQLGTNGVQLFVYGFLLSTVALTHATLCINSLAHTSGKKVYNTKDESRNNWFLALLTLGEGWHNNHHYCPGTARQGFHWWQIDITFYVLKVMSFVGLVWDLKPIPKKAFEESNRIK